MRKDRSEECTGGRFRISKVKRKAREMDHVTEKNQEHRRGRGGRVMSEKGERFGVMVTGGRKKKGKQKRMKKSLHHS